LWGLGPTRLTLFGGTPRNALEGAALGSFLASIGRCLLWGLGPTRLTLFGGTPFIAR